MLIDFLGILLAFVFSAFISGLAYNVTFNSVLPFLQRYDKVQLLASTVLGGTILVSCFALVKAVSIAQVANGLPDQETSELWQAAAALVQVPLIGVASVALSRVSASRTR